MTSMNHTSWSAEERFSVALRCAMRAKGWNAVALARHAAVHMPTRIFDVAEIEGYIAGAYLPLPGELIALAQALGTSPADLLEDGEERCVAELRFVGNGKAWLRLSARVSQQTGDAIRTLIATG